MQADLAAPGDHGVHRLRADPDVAEAFGQASGQVAQGAQALSGVLALAVAFQQLQDQVAPLHRFGRSEYTDAQGKRIGGVSHAGGQTLKQFDLEVSAARVGPEVAILPGVGLQIVQFALAGAVDGDELVALGAEHG